MSEADIFERVDQDARRARVMTGMVVTVGLLLVGVTATIVAAGSIEAAEERKAIESAIEVLKNQREELRTRVEGLEAEQRSLEEDLPPLRQEAEVARKTIAEAEALGGETIRLKGTAEAHRAEMIPSYSWLVSRCRTVCAQLVDFLTIPSFRFTS